MYRVVLMVDGVQYVKFPYQVPVDKLGKCDNVNRSEALLDL